MRARIVQRFTWDGSETIGETGESSPERVDHLENVGVHINGTFEAEVKVEGRAAPEFDFQTLDTFTDTGAFFVVPNDVPLYQLKITVSSWTSGEVEAVFFGRTAQS